MRNNEKHRRSLSDYRSMWRRSRGIPLPYRLQYNTWLEWGNYELDGRLANWIVYPSCGALDWFMRWWPHKHEYYREAAHRPLECIYCRKFAS